MGTPDLTPASPSGATPSSMLGVLSNSRPLLLLWINAVPSQENACAMLDPPQLQTDHLRPCFIDAAQCRRNSLVVSPPCALRRSSSDVVGFSFCVSPAQETREGERGSKEHEKKKEGHCICVRHISLVSCTTLPRVPRWVQMMPTNHSPHRQFLKLCYRRWRWSWPPACRLDYFCSLNFQFPLPPWDQEPDAFRMSMASERSIVSMSGDLLLDAR